MLYGREEICARLDSLVSSVGQGLGGSLAVLGPAGIGKTVLLDHVARQAADLQVLRVQAAPSEASVPYAGLSQLLSPLMPLLPRLPSPQLSAMRAALAIGPSGDSNAFAVLAGTLELLAVGASSTPIVVLIDDAHWLDAASRDAVLFAERRMTHDQVLFVLAYRLDAGLPAPPPWLPALEVPGLPAPAAARLLEEQGVDAGAAGVGWLVEATGGNPLALRDLPRYVRPDDFAALQVRAQPVPVGPALTAAYGAVVAELPEAAQTAVVIAAMLDGAASRVVAAALQSAGLPVRALEPAEDAGLLVVGGTVRMRHPLVRSAVVQRARASTRRAAHQAAADGLLVGHRPQDLETRVWHLAEATIGADEATALLLEGLGDLAAGRAGFAAACMTYEKAAELSPSRADRARRLLAAAEAAFTGGMLDRSTELLRCAAEETEASAGAEGAIEHLRGRLATWSGDPPGAARQLWHAAERLRPSDPLLSLRLAVDATVAAILSGKMDMAKMTAQVVSHTGAALGPAGARLGDLLVGSVQAMSGDGNGARALLDCCYDDLASPELPPELLEQQIYLATAYSFIDVFDRALLLYRRATASARRHGAIGLLPFALTHGAVTEYRVGSWDTAYALVSEALSLVEDCGRSTDRPNALAVLAMIDAGRGRPDAAVMAADARDQAAAMGARFVEAQGCSMLGLLELGRGRPGDAVAPLQQCGQLALDLGLLELGHLQWAPELVEAWVRLRQADNALPVLDTMRSLTHSGTTALNRALLARCEGLLAADDSWDSHFRESLALHAGPDTRPFEAARTRLCFGERLRRHRRRREAREHLTSAWETFSALGAASWSQRTSQEIAATGATAPGPVMRRADLLTSQELQVALAVSEGATNREVASALFLSHKTVEFHLSSIYRRLGLRTRSELADLLRKEGPRAAGTSADRS